MKTILALLMTFTSIIAHSESEMLRLMRLSCESSKSARACYNYANLLHRRQKTQEARIYFKKGCQKGYAPSCNQITSEKLINATFVKAKEKKKVQKIKLDYAYVKKLQTDTELNKIFANYCDKKQLKEACFQKQCIETPDKSECNQSSADQIANKTLEKIKPYMKEIVERDRDKLETIKTKKQKVEYTIVEAEKLLMKRLAKECDNGRLKSCFTYELSSRIKEITLENLRSISRSSASE